MLGSFAVSGVNKRNGITPVKLVENGIERRIAQVALVDARKQPNAVEAQDVKGVSDFCQCAIDIG
jgi:hypothetical protein